MIAVAVAAIAALAAGYLFDSGVAIATFAALMLALVIYHVRELGALTRWLDRGGAPEPPRRIRGTTFN